MNQFKVFTSHGVKYVTAENRQEAIAAVKLSPPYCIVHKVYRVKVWTDVRYNVERIDEQGRTIAVISHRGKTEWSRSHAFAIAKECRGKGWKCRVVEA